MTSFNMRAWSAQRGLDTGDAKTPKALDVKAMLTGLNEYLDEVKANTAVLKSMGKEKVLSAELKQSLAVLEGLDKSMTSMTSGTKANSDQMKEWFKKFKEVNASLESAGASKSGSYTDDVKEKQRQLAKERAERKEANVQLSKTLGSAFEDVVTKNASSITGAGTAGLKTALFGLLGPAGPLLGMLDKTLDIEAQGAKLGDYWARRQEKKSDAAAKRNDDALDDLTRLAEESTEAVKKANSTRARDAKGHFISDDPNYVKAAKASAKSVTRNPAVAKSEAKADETFSQVIESTGSYISIMNAQTDVLHSDNQSIIGLMQDTEESRRKDSLLQQAHQDNLMDKMLNAVHDSKGSKKKSETAGGWFDKLKDQFSLKNLAPLAKGLGVAGAAAGGAYGMYDSAKDLAGDKYKNADGSRKDFTDGGLNSRAGSYGQSALSGAALGAAVGSVVPVLGTAIGAGVGAAVGVGVAIIADYHKEIEEFMKSSGVDKAWDTSMKAVQLGYNWLADRVNAVGDWFSTTSSEIAKTGVLGYTKAKAASMVAVVSDGLGSATSYLESMGMQVSANVKDLATSSAQQVADYMDKLKQSYGKDGILGVAGTVVNDYLSQIGAVLQAAGSVGKQALDWIDSKLDRAASFLGIDYKSAKKSVSAAAGSAQAGVASAISGAASSAQSSVASATAKAAPMLGSAAASTTASVGSAVSSVGSSVGSSTIQGVGARIQSAAPSVGSAVSSAVTGVGSMVGKGLGALSAKYESGKDGGAAIGYDKAGGTSYGNYQIASNVGMVDKFLDYLDASGHKDWADKLRSAGPSNTGSTQGKFPDAWRKLASTGGKEFDEAQHKFIENTSYAPLVKKLAKATGVDIGSRSQALQDAVWSTSVNHGSAFQIVSSAIAEAGGASASDSDLIKAIYGKRSALVNNLASKAEAKGDTKTASMFRGMATGRYASEEKQAQGMLASSGSSSTVSSSPMSTAVGSSPAVASVAGTANRSSTATASYASPDVPRVSPQSMETNVTTVASAAPSRGASPSPTPSNTIDTVPGYLTDEGLIMLNVSQLV